MIERIEIVGEPVTIVANCYVRMTGDEKVDIPLYIKMDELRGLLWLVPDLRPVKLTVSRRMEQGY